MDSVDKAILNLIQGAFPVDSRPYQTIGIKTGTTEMEAYLRIEKLKNEKIIRRVGGIFDSCHLGYISTLCAAKVPADKIPVLAELMQSITEITHSYIRNHTYNMWFTIIACSPQRMEQILDEIKKALGSDEVYSIPAKNVFKIKVCLNFLDMDQKEENRVSGTSLIKHCVNTDQAWNNAKKVSPDRGLSDEEKALIRLLQGDLASTLTPFSFIAEKLNIGEKEVLEKIDYFLERGILRRIGAILYHQKAGFTSNAMGVWCVPEKLVVEVGLKMAASPKVSHCYERPRLPGFPYNLFTMIHGHSDEGCREIMNELSKETGITDHTMLFSHRELKKSSMRYFV
ncbi:Lrp/AsnC family transcriptional regulator [Dehalobacter sp. DCM]|uniref:siroheme decarboxylase subunit beta n=1 Tax=Dehalobacter sp. DCM TaxID=2907827 RepID=UPI0030817785|nr:Lrp/AsnC family transcriptional regulator [Dehalobacter sp. DCM]